MKILYDTPHKRFVTLTCYHIFRAKSIEMVIKSKTATHAELRFFTEDQRFELWRRVNDLRDFESRLFDHLSNPPYSLMLFSADNYTTSCAVLQ